jgi:hypothetical protein
MLKVNASMFHVQCIILSENGCGKNAEAAENGNIFQLVRVFQPGNIFQLVSVFYPNWGCDEYKKGNAWNRYGPGYDC